MSTTQLTPTLTTTESYSSSSLISFLSIFTGIFLFYMLVSSLLSITSSSMSLYPSSPPVRSRSRYRKYYNINGTKYYYCPYRKKMIKL